MRRTGNAHGGAGGGAGGGCSRGWVGRARPGPTGPRAHCARPGRAPSGAVGAPEGLPMAHVQPPPRRGLHVPHQDLAVLPPAAHQRGALGAAGGHWPARRAPGPCGPRARGRAGGPAWRRACRRAASCVWPPAELASRGCGSPPSPGAAPRDSHVRRTSYGDCASSLKLATPRHALRRRQWRHATPAARVATVASLLVPVRVTYEMMSRRFLHTKPPPIPRLCTNRKTGSLQGD